MLIDDPVPSPTFVPFSGLPIGADFVATSDGKHYTKVDVSQSFRYDDKALVALAAAASCDRRVAAKVIFTAFVAPPAP